MKFNVLTLKPLKVRLGKISEVDGLPSFSLETPNLLFYTRRGCMPHLTQDVMEMLTTASIALQFPLSTMYPSAEAIEKSKTSLATFVGLPEYFSYCFVQDPTECIPQGYHRGDSATIWTKQGKCFVSVERYMRLMEAFKPNMYVSMSDGDTNTKSSSKRTANAASITNKAFDYCYKQHISSEVLKNKALIAAVEGGYDLALRERCAQHVSKFPVSGYLIDGLYTDGNKVNDIPFETVEIVVKHTLEFLPETGVRIVHGAWSPKSVLKMVKMGIDLFDTSFPNLVTDCGCALVFNYNVKNILGDNVELYDNDSVNFEELGRDHEKELPHSENPLLISLRNKRYFDDLSPLVKDCTCLTCSRYTKAYLHHLLCAKELLAMVLLIIHNLHHYMKFFDRLKVELQRISKELPNSGQCCGIS